MHIFIAQGFGSSMRLLPEACGIVLDDLSVFGPTYMQDLMH